MSNRGSVSAADREEPHEVYACYSGGHGEPYYQPFLGCSCGFGVREETWEEAGYAFDGHVKQYRAAEAKR